MIFTTYGLQQQKNLPSNTTEEQDLKLLEKRKKFDLMYTEEFREELLGWDLVIRGVCTKQDLWTSLTYSDVLKLNQAITIKMETEANLL